METLFKNHKHEKYISDIPLTTTLIIQLEFLLVTFIFFISYILLIDLGISGYHTFAI